MKIFHKSQYFNKLLKVKFLKTKIYTQKCIFTNLILEDMEHKLKKGFQIIYNYHV